MAMRKKATTRAEKKLAVKLLKFYYEEGNAAFCGVCGYLGRDGEMSSTDDGETRLCPTRQWEGRRRRTVLAVQ